MKLLIPAGGKGTRYLDAQPKALGVVNGEENLIHTLHATKEMFDETVVVVNEEDEPLFRKSICKTPFKVTLMSLKGSAGQGSGHGVMESLKRINLNDEIVIFWGDAHIIDAAIVEELISYRQSAPLIVPVWSVPNPYVSFNVDDHFNAKSVDFSKYGEVHARGYQDRCLFRARRDLLQYMMLFDSAVQKNGRYITETREFEFLYIIHVLYNFERPAKCYVTELGSSVQTYNTVDELKDIKLLVGPAASHLYRDGGS
jgi:molybdopterin-guanine dinucleotide biosynthesis protein A